MYWLCLTLDVLSYSTINNISRYNAAENPSKRFKLCFLMTGREYIQERHRCLCVPALVRFRRRNHNDVEWKTFRYIKVAKLSDIRNLLHTIIIRDFDFSLGISVEEPIRCKNDSDYPVWAECHSRQISLFLFWTRRYCFKHNDFSERQWFVGIVWAPRFYSRSWMQIVCDGSLSERGTTLDGGSSRGRYSLNR